MRERERRILGWCDYCHEPVYEDEEYLEVESAEEYLRHEECDIQKHTYGDGFYDEDE